MPLLPPRADPLCRPSEAIQGPLLSSAARLLAVVGLSAIALWVLSQVASLVNAVSVGPPWAQYAAYIVVGGLVLALTLSTLRLLVLWRRLAVAKPISMRQLDDLAHRAELRVAVRQDLERARQELRVYVDQLPYLQPDADSDPAQYGFTDEQLRQLRDGALALKEDGLPASFWLERFRTNILRIQNEAAEACIKRYAIAVGVQTAILPNAVIDVLAVAIMSSRMAAQLCAIYNLRTSRWGTAVLLAHALVNMYVAGHAQATADVVAEQIMKHLSEGALARVGEMAVSRTTEGIANARLIRRLGYMICTRLQTIQD